MSTIDPSQERLRELPSVEHLLARVAGAAATAEAPRELTVAWVRMALAEAREEIRRASGPAPASRGALGSALETERAGALPATREAWLTVLTARIEAHLVGRQTQRLRRVINLTGVLLHTNLGRAPLPAAAQRSLTAAAAGYSSLEMDLESGRRRSRLEPIRKLIPLVTGAEAGIAVHNNAAAVYLVLTALAAGREVIVSRGHLVEIGGSFRLPEIMAASGAKLVEVGSTNRTRIEDYSRALTPATALLLQVHPSNFRLIGFTEEVSTADLAALAREREVALVHDVGSGALAQHGPLGFDEPRVQDSLAAGADIVCFSGDKLLGGPQAGILAGRKDRIDALSRHPVARVVRLDKTALAALEATLEAWLDPNTAHARIPLLSLLGRTEEDLSERADWLAGRLREVLPPEWEIAVARTESEVGGGSLPGLVLPSRAVMLAHPRWSPDRLARALRLADPAVAGRIEKDRVLLDVRALLDGEEEGVVRAAASVAGMDSAGKDEASG